MDWFSCLGGVPILMQWLIWLIGLMGLFGLFGIDWVNWVDWVDCLFPLSCFVLWFLFGCACVVWLFLCFVSLLNCSCGAWMLETRIFKHSGWFLSCMVVYWFFFKPLAYLLKNLTLLKTASWMNNFKLTFFCFIWTLFDTSDWAQSEITGFINCRFWIWYKESKFHLKILKSGKNI